MCALKNGLILCKCLGRYCNFLSNFHCSLCNTVGTAAAHRKTASSLDRHGDAIATRMLLRDGEDKDPVIMRSN